MGNWDKCKYATASTIRGRAKQEDKPSRPEAIRRLVELGLKKGK
jgi:hypothetical protein